MVKKFKTNLQCNQRIWDKNTIFNPANWIGNLESRFLNTDFFWSLRTRILLVFGLIFSLLVTVMVSFIVTRRFKKFDESCPTPCQIYLDVFTRKPCISIRTFRRVKDAGCEIHIHMKCLENVQCICYTHESNLSIRHAMDITMQDSSSTSDLPLLNPAAQWTIVTYVKYYYIKHLVWQQKFLISITKHSITDQNSRFPNL